MKWGLAPTPSTWGNSECSQLGSTHGITQEQLIPCTDQGRGKVRLKELEIWSRGSPRTGTGSFGKRSHIWVPLHNSHGWGGSLLLQDCSWKGGHSWMGQGAPAEIPSVKSLAWCRGRETGRCKMNIGFLWVFSNLCGSFIPGRCGVSPAPGAVQAGRRGM